MFFVAEVDSRTISIQIEVFPLINYPLKEKINHKIDLIDVLETYIAGLGYLTELLNLGFGLHFIQEEGIWFVRKSLDKEPDEKLCNLLTLSDQFRL